MITVIVKGIFISELMIFWFANEVYGAIYAGKKKKLETFLKPFYPLRKFNGTRKCSYGSFTGTLIQG